ncbi:MAG: hypothetical protein ACRYF3_02660, partial [Janthinobacterium lividum]
EASAADIPTTLVLATTLGPAQIDPVLASWAPLMSLLDGVDLVVVRAAPGSDRDETRLSAAHAASAATTDPASTVLLVTVPQIAVGAEWIIEHARHHTAGAEASTGPVRGSASEHPTESNVAVRMEALQRNGLHPTRPDDGITPWTLVHAVTPIVATLRVTLRALP